MKKKIFLNLALHNHIIYRFYLYYNIYIRHYKFFKRKSYSQLGEDVKINRIIPRAKGFYVDIGCNHPIRNNNTYLLYKKGWRGLNIDLSKLNIDLFKIIRPDDKNICEIISNKEGKVNVYIPNNNPSSYESSINKEFANKLALKKNYKHKRIIKKALNWNAIIKKYNIKINKIDFLKIDVEGIDLDILKSINIKKYKVKVIMIETPNFDVKIKKKVNKYLKKLKYKKIYSNILNSIFVKI